MKKVAIFTTDLGHLSIAQAIADKLKDSYQAEVHRLKTVGHDSYLLAYQFFPGLYKLPFKVSQTEFSVTHLNRYLLQKYQQDLEEIFSQHQPDLVISTHLLLNPGLEKILAEKNIPFINILTDPWTVHRLMISSSGPNLAFDKGITRKLSREYPQAEIVSSGWFTHAKFEQEHNSQEIKEQLGLETDKLTFLLSSGSAGTNMIMKILPTLLFSQQEIQVVVACGNNKLMYRAINNLKSILESTSIKNKLVPLNFTTEMEKYMQAADLVIGKAGPNTLFETAATETPFFAITHIPGQESGNLDLIRKYKLGYVEENPIKATKLLNNIARKPQQLKKFKRHLRKMKKHNQNSINVLKKEITAALGEQ